jgi:hypothetical protein
MRGLLAGLFTLGALVVGIAPSAGAGASSGFRPSGIVYHSGAPAARPHTAAARTTAAATFDCGAITCDAYEAGVNGFLQDVAADKGTSNNVYSVATQYSDSIGNVTYNETFGGTYTDTTVFPANQCPAAPGSVCLTELQLAGEIQKDLTKNGWTTGGTKLYILLLPAGVDTCFDGNPNACASNTFCAYHDSTSSLIFAVEPFNTSFGCGAGNEQVNPQGFPNGMEIDETVNTISHEANEAITDPYGSGWWTAIGSENGDLCAWWFGAPLGTAANGQPYNQVINGHDYSLQQEYSNAANAGAGGCLQHLGGTASTVSPYAGDDGPLLFHNGPVMRSATVYTIFWLPGPTPELSTAPVVTGQAAVAHTLSTTTGTWTSSPTSYAYKWERCDNAGANCTAIGGAKSSTYKPVSGDVGHEIRSLVLAKNANGPAAAGYATSAPTAVVTGAPKVVNAPTITGAPKVGMKLTVNPGTWTNSPTHFAYQWLRCSASGTSCKAIMSATKASYKAASTDAGHTLAAKVTASNSSGPGKAKTAPTGVVAH